MYEEKILKNVAVAAVITFSLIYACQDMINDSSTGKESNNQAILSAQNWYEANKPGAISLRSSDQGRELLMKPTWKNAYHQSDNAYDVVETELLSKGRIAYLDAECYALYKQKKDEKFNQSLTRLIFRTEKKTGKTDGFLMTIVPNADWLVESNFKPFKQMTYLKKNKRFGGQIIYHNLEGKFVNGWQYENGQITGAITSFMNETDGSIALRSDCIPVEYYSLWLECTDWYTQHESGDTYEGSTNCSLYWQYDGTVTVCGSGGDGNGGYNGGGGAPSIFAQNSLGQEGEKTLKDKLNEMIKQCGYAYIHQQMLAAKVSFSDVTYNSSLQSGSYNPNTGVLAFNNISSINQAFPEEFIHLYQNELYGGIARYLDAGGYGTINIEFEAKLIQDILCRINGSGCFYFGQGKNLDIYDKWIEKITNEGTHFPNFLELETRNPELNNLNYWDFMNDFKNKIDWNYKGLIDLSLEPRGIINVSENSECN